MTDRTGVTTNPQLLREVADPENNEAAWRTFLERYQPLIHGWCCRSRLSPDQSEEVTGRVLAKLVTAMRTKYTHDPACRFRGWLRTVVQNEVITFWREQVRRPGDRASGDPAVYRELERVETPAALDELAAELDEALERDLRLSRRVTERVRARVQENTWRAFWLTTMTKQPAADVARRLGMTVAAVYMAKSRVGRLLQEEGMRLCGPDAKPEEGEP
jgi:RNA polymerase sigma-70 factor, ECF subfamily